MISLTYVVHDAAPDFTNEGFKFFLPAGAEFDAADFAEAYRLNRPDLDADDVHAVQDATSGLNDGQWIEVSCSEK